MSKPRFLGYLKHPITKQDKHNLRYQRNRERRGRGNSVCDSDDRGGRSTGVSGDGLHPGDKGGEKA